MSRNYIILNNNKQPIHKFKNESDRKTWDEVKDFENVATIVPEPFIVLDFDTKTDAEIMLEIVEKLDLHCNVMQTDRGFHFWFRCLEPVKNFVKNRLAIGIYCDRKVWGRNAYVKIKGAGKMREWLRQYPDNDVDFLPKWLCPVATTSDHFRFIGMGEGGGRNQALFEYILVLQSAGFKRSEIIQALEIINKFVFSEPLSKYEMSQIYRDEAFKDEEEIEQEKETRESESGVKFNHVDYSNALKEQNQIITIHDIIYIYDDGYYKAVDKEIEKQLIALCPMITQHQRSEVLSYLKIDTSVNPDNIHVDPFIVNMENGRFDLRDGTLYPYDPSCYEFSRIPVMYDPNAYCPAVDKMVGNVFCHDRQIIDLFEEVLASCLVRKAIWQKAFVFYGSGSNGKSKLFEMMIEFLGQNNVSTVELDKLGRQFATAELEYKLANIGDDLNYTKIRDNGTVKKLITGDALQVERKFGNPFTFRSYATQIFACNDIPHTPDKSDGMLRRLCLVPCMAKFKDTDPDFDPHIIDKVTTPEARSYLFNMALKGFARLIKNNHFTEAKIVQEAKRAYVIDNSTVLSWVEDVGHDAKYLLSKSCGDLYLEFRDWCNLNGVREIVGKKGFNKELIQNFNFHPTTHVRTVDGHSARFFLVGLED